MIPFWVHFNSHGAACIEAENEQQARRQAEALTHCAVTSCQRLPYPAEPRIGEQSVTPSFCQDPEHCGGRSACPKRYACTE